jgi:hypothetical protein
MVKSVMRRKRMSVKLNEQKTKTREECLAAWDGLVVGGPLHLIQTILAPDSVYERYLGIQG